MKALQDLRHVLKAIAREVDVLPAAGGAAEDLEHPDFEEREDMAVNEEEKIFDSVFERDHASPARNPYRPAPPVGRTERHLFRYFLDGSFRSYFLGTVLENERESPVHYAQIGACVLRRENDGSVRREALRVENLLLAARRRLSEQTWNSLGNLSLQANIRLVDLTEPDVISRVLSDFDLRNRSGGKVRFSMRTLEAEMIRDILPRLAQDCWLVADGSLLFDPILAVLSGSGCMQPVIGVAKNFRKDPQFVFGRGPGAERRSVYGLLKDLEVGHRTAAFSARGGRVVFWYVRLREQSRLDYPLMGVVKVELVNPSREPVPSELVDLISRALVGERHVTPHGRDGRWHAHLYPVFLAERAVKESFLSREAVRQFLRWR